jgi:predicted dehydrogenase
MGWSALRDRPVLPDFVDEFGPQIEAFSQAIRGGPIPPSGGRDGYVDMAIIEAIYGAAQAGIPQAVKLHCNVET